MSAKLYAQIEAFFGVAFFRNPLALLLKGFEVKPEHFVEI
jgi:hypothetical protein